MEKISNILFNNVDFKNQIIALYADAHMFCIVYYVFRDRNRQSETAVQNMLFENRAIAR